MTDKTAKNLDPDAPDWRGEHLIRGVRPVSNRAAGLFNGQNHMPRNVARLRAQAKKRKRENT